MEERFKYQPLQDRFSQEEPQTRFGQFNAQTITEANGRREASVFSSHYNPCFPENFLDYAEGNGTGLLIPLKHLHGIQDAQNYRRSDRKSIEQAYRNHGFSFLLENPIPVCAVPTDTGNLGKNMTLFLLNGHHRARYSPVEFKHRLPCVVYTKEQAMKIVNTYHREEFEGEFFSPQHYVNELFFRYFQALETFSITLDKEKLPEHVSGVSDMEGLKQKFTPFPVSQFSGVIYARG